MRINFPSIPGPFYRAETVNAHKPQRFFLEIEVHGWVALLIVVSYNLALSHAREGGGGAISQHCHGTKGRRARVLRRRTPSIIISCIQPLRFRRPRFRVSAVTISIDLDNC